MNFLEAIRLLNEDDGCQLIRRPCFYYAHGKFNPTEWSYWLNEWLEWEVTNAPQEHRGTYLPRDTSPFKIELTIEDYLADDWIVFKD